MKTTEISISADPTCIFILVTEYIDNTYTNYAKTDKKVY
jgi:hypothetical protein